MPGHDATTLRGTPTYGAAKFSTGLTAGVLSVPGLVNATVITIEAWLSTVNGSGAFVAFGNTDTGLWVGINGNVPTIALVGGFLGATGGTFAGQSGTAVAINNGAQHHVAFVMDGTTAKIFVDGALTIQAPFSGIVPLTTGTTAIGGYGSASANDWFTAAGTIDELRISSVARYTAAFTPAVGAFATDASTTALFHLDGNGVDSSVAATNATGYTLAASPASVTTGSASTITATLTGGTALSASLVVTLADSLGSTVSGTITIANGSTTGTATVNPSAVGTHAITASHTGGGFTGGDGSASFAATAVAGQSVPITAANVSLSPYGWDASLQAVNAGQYLRATLTTSAAANLTLALTSASFASAADASKPIIGWSIDGGPIQSIQLTTANLSTGSITLATGLAAGSHSLYAYYRSSDPYLDRWTPAGVFAPTALAVSAGTLTVATLTALAKRAIFWGDSITEGEQTEANGYAAAADAYHGWVRGVASAIGAEYSQVGFGGQGWTTTAADAHTPGFTSSWNFLHAGAARSFSVAPDYVFINQGTNGNSCGTTGTVSAFLTALRSAVGASCKVFLLIPFNGSVKSTTPSLPSEYATYQGGSPNVTVTTTDGIAVSKGTVDAATFLLDLGTAATVGLAGVASANSYDGTHPSAYANTGLASMVSRGVQFALTGSPGTVPTAADVRFGTATGSTTGTLHVPTPAQVLATIPVDASTGTVAIPTASQVQLSVTFGPGSTLTGTYDPVTGRYTNPGVANVLAPTAYTFAGTALTGTATASTGTVTAKASTSMGQALEIKAGFGQQWVATLRNSGVAVAYTTSATLDATLWRGGGEAALFNPTVAWIDAPNGKFTLTIAPNQTTALDPGEYSLEVGITPLGGVRSLGFAGVIRITDAPGTNPAPVAWCTYQDMLDYSDQVSALVGRGVDVSGFLNIRARITLEVSRDIVTHYQPTAGLTRTRKAIADPIVGFDVPDPTATPITKAALTAALAAGGLILEARIREVVARRSIGVVLSRQVSNRQYADEASMQRELADRVFRSYHAQVDLNNDGVPEVLIGRDCTFLPAGAAP